MLRGIMYRFLGWTLLLFIATTSLLAEVPQLIDYQGRLNDSSGSPIPDTTIDITFTIYRGDGAQVWTSSPQPVTVKEGLFRYTLGSNASLPNIAISSEFPRFLGIKVGDDPELTPREQLVSVPYSYKVGSIDGAEGGDVSGTLTLSDAGYTLPTTDGTSGQVMSTDGSGSLGWTSVSSVDYWYVVDSVLTTNNKWGLIRGNTNSAVLGTNKYSQVNLGLACTTGVDATSSYAITISGGEYNRASSSYTTVAGGRRNEAHEPYASVGGGNTNVVDGEASHIGGGQNNIVTGQASVIAGGVSNEINPGGFCTIAGGNNNQSLDNNSTVGGGYNNLARNAGTVPGGILNEANGNGALAAGRRAHAVHKGTFVWADNQDADFTSTDTNQFLIRTGSGVGINCNDPQFPLDVEGIVKARNGFAFADNSWQTKAAQFTPIGAVIAWLKDYTNTPTFLPSEWVECNGQTLHDAGSPYDGQVIPNLNGQGRFLMGGNSSGTTGGSNTHNHDVDVGDYPSTYVPGPANFGHGGTHSTDTKSHIPPYYQVVWIMKVK